MRITYIKLVNVASLYTGSNIDTLEVDFSCTQNSVILLTGPNGCGKTTLESCLHPFAYNGTGDDRSGESLIIKKKNGYKEVHLMNGSDEYIIKHYYTASGEESHSVKSYIQKNDVELNPNGNVTSFKEFIQLELGMTTDYLKLVRLGPNMINFIDMKPTERKSYIGAMLDETEIYLRKLKKVMGDMKVLKTMIAQDASRLNKLGITDVTAEEEYLEKLKNVDLANIENVVSKLTDRRAILTNKLKEVGKSGSTVMCELQSARDAVKELNNKLGSKRFKMITTNVSSEEIQDKLISYTSKLEANKARRSMLINDADNCSSDLHDLYIKKDKLDKNEEMQSLIAIIKDLSAEVKAEEDNYKNFTPEYTSADINELLTLLDKWQSTLLATYEVGEKPVKKVATLMRNSESVESYLSKKLDSIYSNNMSSRSADILKYLKNKFPELKKDLKPSCGDDSCMFVQLIRSIQELSAHDKDKTVESEDFYSYMQIAYANISSVRNEMIARSDLFRKMPESIVNMFTIENFFDHVSKLEFIYDRNIINKELTIITEREVFMDKKSRLELSKEHLKSLSQNQGSDFVDERIKELEERLNDDKKNIGILNDDIAKLEESINEIRSLSAIKTEFEELNSELATHSNECMTLASMWDDISKYNEELQTISKRLEQAIHERTRIQDNITAIGSRLSMYYNITKELKKIHKEYDERELTRYSLSSKEGIPLVYINLYLKKTRKIVNDMLDIVYGGELRITDFDVSADSFNIPYEKNGNIISDAHYASQGEMSFLSTILSFALSMQSIAKYNIMLLDEIDGPLDESNRKNFILVLEHLMKKIGAEQVFLITHNNMFDMYDVSRIDMGHIVNNKIVVK